MRIVNVIQRYPPAIGGAEAWCQEVCRHLARKGHDVDVLTLDVIDEDEFFRKPQRDARSVALGPWDDDEGVRVRRFRRWIPLKTVYVVIFRWLLDKLLGIYFYGPHSLEMYWRMGHYLRRADVVFLHALPHPHNIVACLWARWLGKPVCIVPHFHPGHPYYERRLSYWVLRSCQTVFADTAYERDYLVQQGIPSERIAVTGIGIDAQRYAGGEDEAWEREFRARHGLSDGTRLVLFVGRKVAEKGIPELFAACESLAAERDVALVLIGPDSDWYRRWRPEQRGALRTIDLGRASEADKLRLLAAADVLALPSRFEAFGIVFLEAWAARTPVVASDFGPIPTVLGDGGLVPPVGDTAALATALARVLDDEELSRNLVRAGRERLETIYHWDTIASLVERRLAESAPEPAIHRAAAIPAGSN